MVYSLRFSVWILSICLLPSAICLVSCGDSKYSGFEKTPSGLRYKFHVHGKDTAHPKYGEIVRLKMLTRIGDSTVDNTSLIYPDGVRRNLREPIFKGAVEEGIHMMAIGDSATFLVPTDSVNKFYPSKDSAKNYLTGEYLEFNVKLENIQTMQDIMWEQEQQRKMYMSERKEKEPKELSQYITDNHIDAKPAKSGMYFIETAKGKGASPKDGDSVLVHYTGTFLNGTIFDSSVKRGQPFTFAVGEKKVIEGWEQAIKMMKKGSAATIILPSSLAYDSSGVQDPRTGKYFLPPYMPLKFDIQLLDIKSKK
ncbi:MAG: FKBP-type peptidyl-prolyl cis-trans isomerase [Bacteroidetes bacterium]|nr:FKBP-type peptidyl-prolyl cis-trans isomerase [Bacteroidota bacterium]